jgi:mono/diheme cytochrome c family protein
MRAFFVNRAKFLLLAGMVMAGAIVSAGGAASQEVSQRVINRGKNIFQVKANCVFCHGWSGDGQGDERSARPGLSLRETALTRDQLIEVVQCGRPGTQMPFHDGFAYTDERCYGATAEALGDAAPLRAQQTLQKAEIEAVVDYLRARVVGRGPITRAECEEYFEPGAQACAAYQ